MKKLIFFSSFLIGNVTFAQNNTNNYNSVKIGKQEWMEKNLDVLTYRNGDTITQVTDEKTWRNKRTGAWCYYNNDPKNGAIYGKLYNWYAVNDPRGLAPLGWHIPKNEEWKKLYKKLGGNSVAGGKMKTTGTKHWVSPNGSATNKSGFAGLPGGWRMSDGTFLKVTEVGGWWSATESNTTDAWSYSLNYLFGTFFGSGLLKTQGFSVRCLRN